MKQVGIFEAKTNLSALVDEAASGHDVVITRHGKPVAKLVTYEQRPTDELIARRRQALLEIREMARKRGQHISLEEIKSWIDEGRP